MSNPAISERTTQSRDEVFDVLADANQREILRITHERSPTGITKSNLAYELAAVTTDKPLADVTDDDHQRARLDCSHRSLPALFDAGLLEVEDGRIVTTDHWLFEDPELMSVLEGATDEPDTDFDALFSALADERRRTTLTVLADQYHSLSTETLARDVAAREMATAEHDVSAEDIEQVLVALVHTHLPLLNDAGLIGYDVETETISYEGHPSMRVDWLETEFDASGEEADGPVASSDDVRTLQGRETIITTGQSLCEQAEKELFMMSTTSGLLEEGCFRRIEDALDRGVDVYVGTRDPTVRDVIRDRTPEVVLWEPQLDWVNLPPNGESVGRLVVADREAVMLGTLGTTPIDGDNDETAILGEGPDNGFVVLIRHLLGSRLDQLDAPDENPYSEIPL